MKISRKLTIRALIFVILVPFLLMGISYYRNIKYKGHLTLDKIVSVETLFGNESMFIYTKDSNPKDIEKFISAYNEAKLFNNSLGTTHSSNIVVLLTNGDKIIISGGTQGFQTVSKDGRQFNIRGDKLEGYFKR